MTIDERIEALTERMGALTMNLELASHQQEGQGKRIERLITAAEKDAENIRSLDERMGALTMNLELVSHQQEGQGKRIELLIAAAENDQENIRSLAGMIHSLALITQSHERRLTELEGGS